MIQINYLKFIIFCFCLHKLNMINSRYDLPKVKLRFKTDPSNSILNSAQITHFQKFDANPSVFLDRLKNGKEIHEAYMRYRKLKKHNYIKQPTNRKKSHSLAECQKMNTMILKRQCKKSLDKLSIALQTTFIRKKQQDDGQALRKNKFHQFKNYRNGQQFQKMQELLIDLKPESVSLKITKNSLPYQATLYHSTKDALDFKASRLQYKNQDQKIYRISKLLKNKQQTKYSKQVNVFKIDPWNSDKIFIDPHRTDKYHYENDEF